MAERKKISPSDCEISIERKRANLPAFFILLVLYLIAGHVKWLVSPGYKNTFSVRAPAGIRTWPAFSGECVDHHIIRLIFERSQYIV